MGKTEGPSLPNARVLVADDDPALRMALERALEARGHQVISVHDGGRLLVELAGYLKEGRLDVLDLIVSDVHMPVMSGVQMAMALNTVRAGVPMILMTAFPCAELERRTRELGIELLEKPFELPTFEALVDSCLERSRARLRAAR